jgi:hypothetical protein
MAGNVFVADSRNQRVAEFTAWGQFVRAWGWDVVASGPGNTGTGFEICLAEEGDVCKEGSGGGGAGQFAEFSPQGIAIDSAGNVYVVDRGLPSNQRVQKFDPEGHFLLMFGKGVNETSGGNLCPRPGFPADICKAGGEGTGPGEFGGLSVVGNYIAVDSAGTPSATDDKVYVGDAGRIQRFDSAGEYKAEIPLPGEKVRALAVNPAGDLYAAFCGASCASGTAAKANVEKLSSAGAKLDTITVANPQALATNSSGDLFAVDNTTIRKFSGTSGDEVVEETTVFPFFPTYPFAPGLSGSTGIATGSACLTAPAYNLYVSNAAVAPNGFVRAYGPPPDEAHIALCPPTERPPEIEAQGTLVVEAGRAVVQATINPKFWADTSYYVQYGEAACIKAHGWTPECVTQTPLTEALLGAGAVDVGVETEKIALEGLAPGVEYSYRFAAQSKFDHNGNEVNKKGGPVFGVGGKEGIDGKAAAFTTTTGSPGQPACPNDNFRSGPSALLPDCRAYEMVSPVDKNGVGIQPGRLEAYIQASADGNHLAYTAETAFGDQPGNKFVNEYLASRGSGGWSNHGINAPLGRVVSGGSGYPFREVAAFSGDLCDEWLVDQNLVPLSPEGRAGYANLYRQDLCGAGGFEALTRVAPPAGTDPVYVGGAAMRGAVQGFSADRAHVLVVHKAALTPESLVGNTEAQIYDYEAASGSLRLVSVLPDGSPDPAAAEVGAGGGFAYVMDKSLERAVSADGSRVYWSSGASDGAPQSKIYLRKNPAAEQGECTEAGKACTVAVSSGPKATYWTAAKDGSAALYSEGAITEGKATLYRFDAESGASEVIAENLVGVLGASEDLARIYFASSEDLAAGAVEGEPNLYLEEEGEVRFIGTLLGGGKAGDVDASSEQSSLDHVYNPVARFTRFHSSRITPDGGRIVFESRARLTGFDNTDAKNGEADLEVFTYDAVGDELHCISCSASGVRPSGREQPQAFNYPQQSNPTGVWAAAWIPGFEHQLSPSNVLSKDGKRIFFLSYTPLVGRDTNGAQDVYEWELPGAGGCKKSSPDYHAINGGCVYLISSGESPFESEFWDASPDGRDVFFTTESSLLPQDQPTGLIDVYDAREGGGFAQPTQSAECEGEACQSPPPPPNDPSPASSALKGVGNIPKPKPCSKGKVRRKGRCVAKKKPHKSAKHKRAKHKRGAAR